jgi:hypothetical protein
MCPEPFGFIHERREQDAGISLETRTPLKTKNKHERISPLAKNS